MKTYIRVAAVRRDFILHPSSFILILLVAFTLGACGTTPKRQSTAAKGGYYLNDGPGENPPANLDAIADAKPRFEPLHRGAARPYTVMGQMYVPMAALGPYRARGVASWYGRRYHGKLTAIGEVYDMYGMSAAHPTLPLPSYVRVTHAGSGKSVVVRVNDRGPFIDSRLIDLSYTAVYKLGVLAGGSALVEVEAIVPGAPIVAATAAPLPSLATAGASATVNVPAPAERQIPLATEGGRAHLQLAAFSSNENAEAYAARLRGDVSWLAGQLQVYLRNGLYCVLAGPFANQDEARQTADRISQAMGIKPFVLIR